MGLLLVACVLIWYGIYQGIRSLLRVTSRQHYSPSPPPTARLYSASDATGYEKRDQPRLQTLRASRAEFYRWYGHRGKTPRAIFLISLVLVLHRAE